MNISSIVPDSPLKRIVIAGGGFGGITLVKKFRNKNFQVVLIDRNNYHTFQPLLYQVATGGLEPDSIAYPLRKIFHGYKNFYFRMAEIQRVDTHSKVVETDAGPISYDYLILACGSTNNFFGMDELAAKAMPLKSVTDALDLRSLILQNLEQSLEPGANKEELLNLVVAGGGPTGVETAGALCELRNHVLPNDYPEINFQQTRIILVEAGKGLLAGMSDFSSGKALHALQTMGVEVMLNNPVKQFDGKQVTLADGKSITTRTLIWSAGVKGASIPGIPESAMMKNGRIKVDRFNRVEGETGLFVIGDLAFMAEENYPNGHPMVAPVAMQQAENLGTNLLRNDDPTNWKLFKYVNKGAMATIGRNKAVAELPFLKLSGFLAWLLWMFIHLMTLVGFRNRLVVFVNWMVNYFSYDRAVRLIIRPFNKKM
ncbi:MAG: NAD(P)/FAD-dependent oxidoreductase [Bacteroidetes bacterium]|nr:NAD(P)/FAD-dependent oxidoreductase [Bacteroidota bacterium]